MDNKQQDSTQNLIEEYQIHKDQPIIQNLKINQQEFVDNYRKIMFYLQNYQTQNLDLVRDLDNNLEIVYISDVNQNLLNDYYLLRWVEKEDNDLVFSSKYLDPSNLKDQQSEPSIKHFLSFLSSQIKNNQLQSLYLCGLALTGKSWIVSAFVNSYILKHKISVCYLEMDLLVKYSLSAINNPELKFDLDEAYERMRNCELLVLDNLAKEKYYDHIHTDVILKILSYRLKNNLVTFFISNIALDKLKSYYSNKSKNATFYDIKEFVLIINDLIKGHDKANYFVLEGRNIWDLRKAIDKK